MRRMAERDAKIVELATSPGGGTYPEIARTLGVSKSVVAGVMFRHWHPDARKTGYRDSVSSRKDDR